QEHALLALEHELPAIRQAQVGDQRGYDEKLVPADPQQARRSKLRLQGSALGDGCVRSVERPVRASSGRGKQQRRDDRPCRWVDPLQATLDFFFMMFLLIPYPGSTASGRTGAAGADACLRAPSLPP